MKTGNWKNLCRSKFFSDSNGELNDGHSQLQQQERLEPHVVVRSAKIAHYRTNQWVSGHAHIEFWQICYESGDKTWRVESLTVDKDGVWNMYLVTADVQRDIVGKTSITDVTLRAILTRKKEK